MRTIDTNDVLKEYRSLARHYDQRWSFYIEESLRETLKRFEVQPGDHLLDIGCGTGILLASLSASTPDAKLSGVDPSPEMLEKARRKLDETVSLTHSCAESLPFPDASFDVVVSTSAFHYFRDPPAALREMARVLRPQGRLVVTDWCHDYLSCKAGGIWLRVIHRAHFRTYGKKQYRHLIEQAGFTAVRIDRYKINWRWGLMTAVAQKHAAGISCDCSTQK